MWRLGAIIIFIKEYGHLIMIDLSKTEIVANFDFGTAVDAIKDSYIAASNKAVTLPPVGHIEFPQSNGDCHIKAGHIHGQRAFVIKIATGFYNNPKQGLPSSNGMMVVFSAMTGEPLAVLNDEGWLTDMRTGIGGALATRALSRPDAQRVLILGTGLQCLFQAECLENLSPEPLDYVIWGRSMQKAEVAAKQLVGLGLKARSVENLQDAVANAEIIITTTPSTKPLIAADWVRPGTHITAIGADCLGKQELETGLVLKADLAVCDLIGQSLDHGEFQHAQSSGKLSNLVELGQILSETHPGRPAKNAITISDLTGIAPQDIAITGAVLNEFTAKAE